MSDILHTATVKMMAGYYTMLEEQWKWVLNPKPKLLPQWAWEWMVRTVLRTEVKSQTNAPR